MATTTDNLAVTQQINQLLEARNALLDTQTRSMQQQADIAARIAELLGGKGLSEGTRSVRNMSEAIRESTVALDDATDSARNLDEALEDAASESDGLGGSIAKLSGGVSFATGVFTSMFNILGSIGSLAKNVVKGFVGIGVSIASIPFKILGSLIRSAGNLSGEIDPVRLKMEEIRGQFGDLSSNEGKALSSTLGQFKSEMGDLAGTGLRLSRVFGVGREGLAKAIESAKEIAAAAGPAFNQLIPELSENAVRLSVLTKGFTGSAEATAGMLRHARALGVDGTDYIQEITGMAQQMEQRFGVSAKVLGKSIGEMTSNVSDFGSMSKTQMVAAATYASRLGVEIKDLGGVMQKFLNFEDAAKGAAEMAQAFGMNVDTMELMKGGPEAIEAMRKAFFASGKTIKDLSTAERKLLEQQTGLSGAALESAFATENQSVSYAEMSEASADAEKKQLSQAEVMEKLANSIERVFSSGNKQFTSFFDAFTDGLTRGFETSKEWRNLMIAVSRALRIVFVAGVELGRWLMANFPGIGKMFSGLTKMFDPESFSLLMGNFTGAIKTFVTDIGSGKMKPEEAVRKLVEKIKKAFSDFFSRRGEGQKELRAGATEFGTAIKNIFTGFVTYAVEGLISLMDDIGSWLKSDAPDELMKSSPETGLRDALGRLWVKITDFIGPLFKKLAAAFERNWPIIRDKLTEMWNKFWSDPAVQAAIEELKSKLIEILISVLKAVATVAIIKQGIGHVGGLIMGQIGSSITAAFGGASAGATAATVGRAFTRLMTGALGTALIVGVVAQAGLDVSNAIQKLGPQLEKEGFDPATARIAAGTTGLLNTLTLGLMSEETQASVATSVANFSQFIFTSADKYLGPGVGQSLKQQASGVIEFFGGLGSLLVGLWEGDSAKANAGFDQLASGTIDMLVGALSAAAKGLMKLGPLIIEKMMECVSYVLSKLGNVFLALKDVPFIGPLFELVGNLFKEISSIFDKAAKGWKMFGEFLDKIDISKIFNDSVTAIKDFFGVGDKALGSFGDQCRELNAFIKAPFIEAWGWLKENFSLEKFSEIGGNIVDGIVGAVTYLPKKIGEFFTEAITFVKGIFGIASPSTVFADIGENVVDGMINALTDLPKRAAKIFDQSIDFVKGIFGINSPSTVFAGIGENITEGLEDGLESKKEVGFFDSMLGTLKDGAAPFIEGATGLLTSGLKDLFAPLETLLTTIIEPIFEKAFSFIEPALANVFKGLSATLEKLPEILGPILQPVFAKVVDLLINQLETLIKVIGPFMSKAFTALADIAGPAFNLVLEKISNSSVLQEFFTNVASSIGSGASKLTKYISEIIPPALKNIGSVIVESFTDLIQGLAVLQNLSIENAIVNPMTSQIDSASSRAGEIIEAKIQSFSKGLTVLRQFSSSLDGEDPKIKLAVDIGKSLSGSGKVTVEVKPASFNFNINVTMDAEKIAEGIVETDKYKKTVGLA